MGANLQIEPVRVAGRPITLADFQRMSQELEAAFGGAIEAAAGYRQALRACAMGLRPRRRRQSRGWRRHMRRVKAGLA